MRTEIVIVATKDRLPRLSCTGGLQARLTDPETVHLVSTAASPLGGDDISVRIEVASGAVLRVRTVAASVALPGPRTVRSASGWDCVVDGVLDLDPAPTIVAGNASHRSRIQVSAAADSKVRLRERIQIGRSGESSGFWSGSLDVDVDRRPLLRHRIDLGAGGPADDEIGRPLAMISELRYPAADSDEKAPDTAILLQLAGDATLLTWQGQRLPAG